MFHARFGLPAPSGQRLFLFLAEAVLGIFMVKNLVDDLHYERVGDANVVTILKKW